MSAPITSKLPAAMVMLAYAAAGLSLSAITTTFDLTNVATATFGTDAQETRDGFTMLWSGNTNQDDKIRYTGFDNDRDPILVEIGGSIPTAVAMDVYSNNDVNMDGDVKYTGANNDRDPILVNIGGSIPTAQIFEQLP